MKDMDRLIQRVAETRKKVAQAHGVAKTAQDSLETARDENREAEKELYEETESRVKELSDPEETS